MKGYGPEPELTRLARPHGTTPSQAAESDRSGRFEQGDPATHTGATDHQRHDGGRPLPHSREPHADLDTLMLRAANGDRDAFAGVYDALVQPVMGLACRILRDAGQAEEVTQDVMIEVWRTADRFRPDLGTAKAWVLTLAHRRTVDRVRSVQASKDREVRAGMLSTDRDFDQVAETVENLDERRRVHRCLAALARLQRVPLVLAYYQGMTCLEVARSLSTPEGTVKSRMRKGLDQLRTCLEAGP